MHLLVSHRNAFRFYFLIPSWMQNSISLSMYHCLSHFVGLVFFANPFSFGVVVKNKEFICSLVQPSLYKQDVYVKRVLHREVFCKAFFSLSSLTSCLTYYPQTKCWVDPVCIPFFPKIYSKSYNEVLSNVYVEEISMKFLEVSVLYD